MDSRQHWNAVYQTKAPDQVSWFRPHLETSLSLIRRAAPSASAHIIDIGAGESTLVDDLLEQGYDHLTVLDISRKAIEVTKARLGPRAGSIEWRVADITRARLPRHAYDVWHDRAVFHFLTAIADRAAYVEQVRKSVKPGGHVIISTFGPEGPTKCSGLEVKRYHAGALHGEFGPAFRLVESVSELHQTPAGGTQQFLYCYCVVE